MCSNGSREGPTLLILEPQRTFRVVPTGLHDLEAGFSNLGVAAMVLPHLGAFQTKVLLSIMKWPSEVTF